jgi:hypothetical protein
MTILIKIIMTVLKVLTYTITLFSENPFSHVSNALVQIDILDIDNKPPRFSWSKYTAFVNENEPIGTSIIKVRSRIHFISTSISENRKTLLTWENGFSENRKKHK